MIILICVNYSYKYALNKNNKIEYYFFVNDYIKYKILKYIITILNIIMFIYLRYVVINIIQWNQT